MAKPKLVKKAPPKLEVDQLKANILQMRAIKLRIKALDKEYDELAEPVILTLGVKGILQWDLYRCYIVQQWQRKVPWRELCFEFARKLYPTRKEMWIWMKSLVRKYPKKACAPFAKLTDLKPEKVNQEAV